MMIFFKIFKLNLFKNKAIYTAALLTFFIYQAKSQITISELPSNNYCSESIEQISFTAEGVYNQENIFKVELSDSLGSFNSPTTIGIDTSTTSGTIEIRFPLITKKGTKYHLRITASDIADTSAASIQDISILPISLISAGIDTIACINDTITIKSSSALDNLPVYWTSSGTGTFIKNDTLHPSYIVSTEDIQHDSIYLIIASNNPCVKSDTAILHIRKKAILTVSEDTSSCRGTAVVFKSWADDTTASYKWSNNVDFKNIAVAPEHTTKYYVSATNICGSSVDSVELTILPTPYLSVSSDTTIDYLFPASLRAFGGYSYEWEPTTGLDNPYINNPLANPHDSTLYYVTAWDSAHRCSQKDSVFVSVYVRKYNIWFPSAFTPNKGEGDGQNDLFRPLPLGLFGFKNFNMKIFNRYGNLVFETTDLISGWNGIDPVTNLPFDVGTYLYQATAIDPYGKVHVKTGSVVLLK